MRLKKGFVIKNICGDTIALYAGDEVVDFSRAVSLNASAEFLFRLLEKETSEEELTEQLTAHYDISEEQASRDVKSFVAELAEKDFLDK